MKPMKQNGECAHRQKEKRNYLLSKNFKKYWINYVWQSTSAGIVTFLVIFVFSELIALIILAGIGSTFFTVFTLPGYRTAQVRNVIGSYSICILIGLACSNITSASVSGGLSVGSAAFFMVITDTEHPPAAGIALGLALTPMMEHALAGALFSMIGACLASLSRHALSPWLKDLV